MVRGRVAIQQFFNDLPGFTEFVESAVEIEGEGDFALPWGTYDTTLRAADSKAVKDRGKVLAVWHKESDGTWLVSRVCWNSDLAPVT